MRKDTLVIAAAALVAGGVVATTAAWPAPPAAVPAIAASSQVWSPPPSCTTNPRPDSVFLHGREYEATGKLVSPIPMPTGVPFPGPRIGTVKETRGGDAPPGWSFLRHADATSIHLPVGATLHSFFARPVASTIVAETCAGYEFYRATGRTLRQ